MCELSHLLTFAAFRPERLQGIGLEVGICFGDQSKGETDVDVLKVSLS